MLSCSDKGTQRQQAQSPPITLGGVSTLHGADSQTLVLLSSHGLPLPPTPTSLLLHLWVQLACLVLVLGSHGFFCEIIIVPTLVVVDSGCDYQIILP